MTGGYLVDTSVVSELAKPSPAMGVREWTEAVASDDLFVSVLTLGELRQGIALLGDIRQAHTLDRWLSQVFPDWFEGRILTIDQAVSERWGEFSAAGRQRGKPLPVVDGLLAATADVHGLTLVTRNIRHFADVGVAVFSPWER